MSKAKELSEAPAAGSPEDLPTPEMIASEFGGSPHWEQDLVIAIRAYGERCVAAAEARAEAWRKAAGDMLEAEMDRGDKERLRALFKKGEALQRDAAASGRHLQPTAEEFSIQLRAAGRMASNASAPSGAPESVSERGGGASLKGK